MRKIFLVFAALVALYLTGCPAEPEPQSQNSDIIGTWYGTGNYSSYRLEIVDGRWSFVGGIESHSGSFTRQGTIVELGGYAGTKFTVFGTATLSSTGLSLVIKFGNLQSSTPYIFTKSGASGSGGDGTQMTIRNESSYDLSNVTWSGLKFVTSGQTADLLKGTIAKKDTTEDASGYIYFTRKDIGIELRTQTIATAESSPVTLNDNTVVVEVGNETNTAALSQITKPSMTIKNESSYDLSNVTWSNLQFVSSGQTADLLKGTMSKMDAAKDASGYIYFTRKDSGINLRTQSTSTVVNSPVTINNDTVVVEIGHETNRAALSLIEKTPSTTTTLTWSGSWVKTAPNSYYSNPIGNSAETWETLTINAPSDCMITVNLSSSTQNNYYGDDYGYASYLDGSPSPSQYRLRVSGTSGSSASGTYDYPVPEGTHYLYFGYVKDYSHISGLDRIYVSVTVK